MGEAQASGREYASARGEAAMARRPALVAAPSGVKIRAAGDSLTSTEASVAALTSVCTAVAGVEGGATAAGDSGAAFGGTAV